MSVNIIASSSSGNCIVIKDSGSQIMLDAGITLKAMTSRVNLNEIECVLITHSHMDHFKSAPELIRRGIDVYMSEGARKDKNVMGARITSHSDQFQTENWIVLPFDIIHDAPEPLGYLVQNKVSGKKYLYVVDSATIEYDFSGVNVFIIEANYAEDIIDKGDQKEWLKSRIRTSHFSLDNLKDFLGSSDLSQTEEIFLVHLSDSNSDEERFKREIMELTGIPTYTDTDFLPLKHQMI